MDDLLGSSGTDKSKDQEDGNLPPTGNEPPPSEQTTPSEKDKFTPDESDGLPGDPQESRPPEMTEPKASEMQDPTPREMQEPKAPDMSEPVSNMNEPEVADFKDITNKNLDEEIVASMKEPLRPNLEEITRDGRPFALPWSCEVRELMGCFESQEMKSSQGPWRTSHPFDPPGVMKVVMPEIVGGTASFRSGLSTRSEASTEHLSAAVGITIGYPFLNAGVHVDYDRTVIEHSTGVQASQNASCRVGRVIFEQTPRFAPEAIRILEDKDGLARFRALFGDYYVCGYELGADAGACLSASTRDTSTEQTLTLTVSVKLLWMTESVSHTEHSQSATESATMTFSGYNSLGNESLSRKSESVSPSEQAELKKVANRWLKTIGALEAASRTRMRDLGVHDDQRLPLSACESICRSGLVVRLLMAPFAHLNQFVPFAARNHALSFDLPD